MEKTPRRESGKCVHSVVISKYPILTKTMKALIVTLFILGNVVFFSQLGRDLHHLVWGAETSIFDEFNPAQTSARSESSNEKLLADYRKLHAETEALEKSKNQEEIELIQNEHKDLYNRMYETRSELSERESKKRELRDTWAYSGYGLILILLGFFAYQKNQCWVGVALTITGFTILEYWASPPLFSGAASEFRSLLWSKTVLTIIALGLLYAAANRAIFRCPKRD